MDKLLSLSQSLGLDAEFFHSRSDSLSLGTTGAQIKFRDAKHSEGWAVRVGHEGRVGFAYFEREGDAEKSILLAKKLSRLSPQSKFEFAQGQKYPQASHYDKKIACLAPEDAVLLAKELVGGVQSVKGAIPTEGSVSFTTETYEIANTRGLRAEAKATGMSLWCGANFDGSTGTAGFSHYKFFDEFGRKGREAAQIARQMKGAKKLPSANMTVIFCREALYSLLHGILLPSLNGDWARRKISHFCGREGKQVASDIFTLSDDPLADAAGRSSFDGEGVAGKRLQLIEKGIFRNFLFDRLTASLAGAVSQGRCSRASYAAAPSIGPSNITVEPGSIADLEEEFPDALVLRDFHGEHTANKVTGDFSVSIDASFTARGGPVRGNLLSSNIFDMLKKMRGAEKHQEAYLDMIAPRIAFADMQVVG